MNLHSKLPWTSPFSVSRRYWECLDNTCWVPKEEFALPQCRGEECKKHESRTSADTLLKFDASSVFAIDVANGQ